MERFEYGYIWLYVLYNAYMLCNLLGERTFLPDPASNLVEDERQRGSEEKQTGK
jgi:hypothetical protein